MVSSEYGGQKSKKNKKQLSLPQKILRLDWVKTQDTKKHIYSDVGWQASGERGEEGEEGGRATKHMVYSFKSLNQSYSVVLRKPGIIPSLTIDPIFKNDDEK